MVVLDLDLYTTLCYCLKITLHKGVAMTENINIGLTITKEGVKSVFLPKDPNKAVNTVKDILYDRLTVLRQCVPHWNTPGWEPDSVETQMLSEINFLTDVLDIIERS